MLILNLFNHKIESTSVNKSFSPKGNQFHNRRYNNENCTRQKKTKQNQGTKTRRK